VFYLKLFSLAGLSLALEQKRQALVMDQVNSIPHHMEIKDNPV